MRLNPKEMRPGRDTKEMGGAWAKWAEFLGYEFLVYGLFRVFTGFLGLSYRPEPAAVSMLSVGNALWLGYTGGRTGRKIRNVVLGMWIVGFLIFGRTLPEEISVFLEVLSGAENRQEDFTVLIVPAAAVLSLLVFTIAVFWKKGGSFMELPFLHCFWGRWQDMSRTG